jgi:cytochrome c-type biogenesis protein CcmH
VLLLLPAPPAAAVQPDEVLQDPALEFRARQLSRELRCLVCQNQSIDDSNAELAHDLRLLVRERLGAGDSDAQVLAFLEARYGEFVLLRPPLKPHTLILWLAPLLLVALAALILVRRLAPGAQAENVVAAAAPLTVAEQTSLDRLLHESERPK